MDSKVCSLADAVRAHVRPGDVVHVAYSDARPNAVLMELARAFAGRAPHLTLVTAGMVSVQHALVELGVVDRVVASFIGENFPAARPNRAFQRALAEGRVEVENWSMWGLVARLMAGALGVPFLPVRSMAGSSIGDELSPEVFRTAHDPFGGGEFAAVAALRPDVVLLHGVAADPDGNLVLSAPYGEAHWGALAARRGVVATVERIVSADELRAHQALVRIPAHLVASVSEVRFGAHPYGLYNPGFGDVPDYVEDAEFMAEVREASREPATFMAWIEQWVTGVGGHDEYLAKLGALRLSTLIGQAARGIEALERHQPGTGPATDAERQVIAVGRRIAERVRAEGFDVVLSGVGLANLACWTAWERLRDAGVRVELMAEIGMFGYRPVPGEPFIFSHRNLPTCGMLTDVATVLGGFVSGPASHCLGVLGAGEVDEAGNTNSTVAAGGRFLVGSGGANDIASGADEILLTVAHSRLVDKVSYVTSPGHHVHSIVTSAGVFERQNDGFVLLRYFPTAGATLDDAVAAMRAQSPWRFTVSPSASAEPEPTPEELRALRAYDPHRAFTG